MRNEAEWSPPGWCANPERYTADNNTATEHQVTEIARGFVRALQPDVAVETGTFTGQTTRAIGEALAANGHGVLHGVDVVEEMLELTRTECAGLPVELHLTDGISWLRAYEGPPIAFAWLDSNNDERHLELEELLPKLTAGGIVCIHDTAPGRWGIDKYLEPVVLRHGLQWVNLRTPRGLTILQ